MAGLDRVTVYRTLSALQEAGLVHRVQDKDGVWRFCAHGSREQGCPGNHPHFLCMRCGEMRCLTAQSLPWVETSAGEQVVGKQLVVYGLCAGCASG
jgi:Fur family ferric uptake transcriptional regulator/Fur family zinc uptake transcriptional regulator